jgi:hypothetical protein
MRRWLRRHVAWLDTTDDEPADDPTTTTPTTLSIDEVCALLGNERRRACIRRLVTRDETVDLGALAEQIAADEQDVAGPEALTSQQRKRVYVSLYQTHAPRLADAGVVELGRDGGITPTAEAHRLHDILELLEGNVCEDDLLTASGGAD